MEIDNLLTSISQARRKFERNKRVRDCSACSTPVDQLIPPSPTMSRHDSSVYSTYTPKKSDPESKNLKLPQNCEELIKEFSTWKHPLPKPKAKVRSYKLDAASLIANWIKRNISKRLWLFKRICDGDLTVEIEEKGEWKDVYRFYNKHYKSKKEDIEERGNYFPRDRKLLHRKNSSFSTGRSRSPYLQNQINHEIYIRKIDAVFKLVNCLSANLITQVIHPVVQHIQVAAVIQNLVDVMNKHYLSKAEKFFNLAKMKAYMLKLIEDKLKAEEIASTKPKIVEVTDSETSPVSIKENDIKSVLDSIQNVRNRLKSKMKETEPVDLRRKYSIDNIKTLGHSKTSSTAIKTALNFAEGNEEKIIEEVKENKTRRFTIEKEKTVEKKRDGLSFEKDWFLKKSKCAEKLFSKNYSDGRVVSEDFSSPAKRESSPTDEKNEFITQPDDLKIRDDFIPCEGQKVLIYDEFPSFSEKYPYDENEVEDQINKIEKESQENEVESKAGKEPNVFDIKNIKENWINTYEKQSINKLKEKEVESFGKKSENEKDIIKGRPSQSKSTKASYFPQKLPPSSHAKNIEGEEIPKQAEQKSVKPKSRISSDLEELKEQNINKEKLSEKAELTEEINEDLKYKQTDYRPERQKYFDPKPKDEQDIISKYLSKRIKQSNEENLIEENIIDGTDLKKEKPIMSVKYQQEALTKKLKIEPEESFEDRPKISKLRPNLEKEQAKTNSSNYEDEIGKKPLSTRSVPMKFEKFEFEKQTPKADAMPAKLTDRISYRLPDKNKSEFEIKSDDPLLIPRHIPKSFSSSEVKEEESKKDLPKIASGQSSNQNLPSHSWKSSSEINEDSGENKYEEIRASKFNNQPIKSKVDESDYNKRKTNPSSDIFDSKYKNTEKIEMEPYRFREDTIKPIGIESNREKFNPNEKEVYEKKLPSQKTTFGSESYGDEQIDKSIPTSQKQMRDIRPEELKINKDMPTEIFSQKNLLKAYTPDVGLPKEIISCSNEQGPECGYLPDDSKKLTIEEEIKDSEFSGLGKPLIRKQPKAQRTAKQSSQLYGQVQEEAEFLQGKEEPLKSDKEPIFTYEDKIKTQEKSLEKAAEISDKRTLNPSKGKSIGKEISFYPLKPSSSSTICEKDKKREEEPDQIILKRSENKKLSSHSSKSSGSYKNNEDLRSADPFSDISENKNKNASKADMESIKMSEDLSIESYKDKLKSKEKSIDEKNKQSALQKNLIEREAYIDKLLDKSTPSSQKQMQNTNIDELNQYKDKPQEIYPQKKSSQQPIEGYKTDAYLKKEIISNELDSEVEYSLKDPKKVAIEEEIKETKSFGLGKPPIKKQLKTQKITNQSSPLNDQVLEESEFLQEKSEPFKDYSESTFAEEKNKQSALQKNLIEREAYIDKLLDKSTPAIQKQMQNTKVDELNQYKDKPQEIYPQKKSSQQPIEGYKTDAYLPKETISSNELDSEVEYSLKDPKKLTIEEEIKETKSFGLGKPSINKQLKAQKTTNQSSLLNDQFLEESEFLQEKAEPFKDYSEFNFAKEEKIKTKEKSEPFKDYSEPTFAKKDKIKTQEKSFEKNSEILDKSILNPSEGKSLGKEISFYPLKPISSSETNEKAIKREKESGQIMLEQSGSQTFASHSSKKGNLIDTTESLEEKKFQEAIDWKFDNKSIPIGKGKNESTISNTNPFTEIKGKEKEEPIKSETIDKLYEKAANERNKSPNPQKNIIEPEPYRDDFISKPISASKTYMLNQKDEGLGKNKDTTKETFSQKDLAQQNIEIYEHSENLMPEIVNSSIKLDSKIESSLEAPKNQTIEEEIKETKSVYTEKPIIKKQIKPQRTAKQSSQLINEYQEEINPIQKKADNIKQLFVKDDKIKTQDLLLENNSQISDKSVSNLPIGKFIKDEMAISPLKPDNSVTLEQPDIQNLSRDLYEIANPSEEKKLGEVKTMNSDILKSQKGKNESYKQTTKPLEIFGAININEMESEENLIKSAREESNREKLSEKITDERNESPILQKNNFELQSQGDERLGKSLQATPKKIIKRLDQYKDNPETDFSQKSMLRQNTDPHEDYKNVPIETLNSFISEIPRSLEASEKQTFEEEIKEPKISHSDKDIIEKEQKIQNAAQQHSQLVNQEQKDEGLINSDSDIFLPKDKILNSYGTQKHKDSKNFAEKPIIDSERINEKGEVFKDHKSVFTKENKINTEEASLRTIPEIKDKSVLNQSLGKSIEGEMTIYSSKLSSPSSLNEKGKEEVKSPQFKSEKSDSSNLSFYSQKSNSSIDASETLEENKLDEISAIKSINQNNERKIYSKENDLYIKPTNQFSEICDTQDKATTKIDKEPIKIRKDLLAPEETYRDKLNEKTTDEINESPAFKQNISARDAHEEKEIEKSIPIIQNQIKNIKDEELRQIKDTSKHTISHKALIHQNPEIYSSDTILPTESTQTSNPENKVSMEELQEQTIDEESKEPRSTDFGKAIIKKRPKTRTVKQSTELISQEPKGDSEQGKTGKSKDKDEFSFIEENKNRNQDFESINAAEISEKCAANPLKGKFLETEKSFDPLKLSSLSEENKKEKEDEPPHQLVSKIISHNPSESSMSNKDIETLEEKKIEEPFTEIFDDKNKETAKIDIEIIKLREDPIQSHSIKSSNDRLGKAIESPIYQNDRLDRAIESQIYQKNILELENCGDGEVDKSIFESKKQIKNVKVEELRQNIDTPVDIFSQDNTIVPKSELVEPGENLQSDIINLSGSGSLSYLKDPQKQRNEEEIIKDSETVQSKVSATDRQQAQRSEEKTLQFASTKPKETDSIYFSQDKVQIFKDEADSLVFKEDHIASLLDKSHTNQPKSKSIEKERCVDPLNSSSSSEVSEKDEGETPKMIYPNSERSSLDKANSCDQYEDVKVLEEEKVESIKVKTPDELKIQRIAEENDANIRPGNPFSGIFGGDEDKNTDKTDKNPKNPMKLSSMELSSDKFKHNEKVADKETENVALQEYSSKLEGFRDKQKFQPISKNQNPAGYNPNKDMPIETLSQPNAFQQNTEVCKPDRSLPAETIIPSSSEELHSSEIPIKKEIEEENKKSKPIESEHSFIEKVKEPHRSENESHQFISREPKGTDYIFHYQENEKSKPIESRNTFIEKVEESPRSENQSPIFISRESKGTDYIAHYQKNWQSKPTHSRDNIAKEIEQKCEEKIPQYISPETRDTDTIFSSRYKDLQDKGEIFRDQGESSTFKDDKIESEDVTPEKNFEMPDKSIINQPKNKSIEIENSFDPLNSSSSSEVSEKDKEENAQIMLKYPDSESSSLDEPKSSEQFEGAEISEEEKLEDIIAKTSDDSKIQRSAEKNTSNIQFSETAIDEDKNASLSDIRPGKLIENLIKDESIEPGIDQFNKKFNEEKEVNASELESHKDIQLISAHQLQMDLNDDKNASIESFSQSTELQQSLPTEAINLLDSDNLFYSKVLPKQTAVEEISNSEFAQSKKSDTESRKASQRGENQSPQFIGQESKETGTIFFSQDQDLQDKREAFKYEGESLVFKEDKIKNEDASIPKIFDLTDKNIINQPENKSIERQKFVDPLKSSSSSEISEKDEEETSKIMLKYPQSDSSSIDQPNSSELKTKLIIAENESNITTENQPSEIIFDKENASIADMKLNKAREDPKKPTSIESPSDKLKINEEIIDEEIEGNILELENYEDKQKHQSISTNINEVELKQYKDKSSEEFSQNKNTNVLRVDEDFPAKPNLGSPIISEESQEQQMKEETKDSKPAHTEKAIIKKQKKPQRSEKQSSQYINQEPKDKDSISNSQDKCIIAETFKDEHESSLFEEYKNKTQDALLENISSISSTSTLNLSKSKVIEKETPVYPSKIASSSKVNEKDNQETPQIILKKSDNENLLLNPQNPSSQFGIPEVSEGEKLEDSIYRESDDPKIISINEEKDYNIRSASPLSDTFVYKIKNADKANVEIHKLREDKIKPFLKELSSDEIELNEKILDEKINNATNQENILESEYDEDEKTIKSAEKREIQSKIKPSSIDSSSVKLGPYENIEDKIPESLTTQENISGSECYRDQQQGKSLLTNQTQIKFSSFEPSNEELKQNENIIVERKENPASQENILESECYKDEKMGKTILTEPRAQIKSPLIDLYNKELKQNDERIEDPEIQKTMSRSERFKDEPIIKHILTNTQAQIKPQLIEPFSEEFNQTESITEEEIENPAIQEITSETKIIEFEQMEKPISITADLSSAKLRSNEKIADKTPESLIIQENLSGSKYYGDQRQSKSILTSQAPLIETYSEELKQNEIKTYEKIENQAIQENILKSKIIEPEQTDKSISTAIANASPESLIIQENILDLECYGDQQQSKDLLASQTQIKSSSIEQSKEKLKQNENIADEIIESPIISQENISESECYKDEKIGKYISAEIHAQIKPSLTEQSSEELKQNKNIDDKSLENLETQKNISDPENFKDESIEKPILTETQAQIKSSPLEPSSEELKQNKNIADERIENSKIQKNISESERPKYEPIRKHISTETQAHIKSPSIEPSSEELKKNKIIADERIENPITQENESESEYFKDESNKKPFSTEAQAQIKSPSIEQSSEELKQNKIIADDRIENSTTQENESESEYFKDESNKKPFSTEAQAQIKSPSIEQSSEELKQNKIIADDRIENPTTQENISGSEYFKDEPIRKPISTETQAQIKSPSIEPSSEELKQNKNIDDKSLENPKIQKNISGPERLKYEPIRNPISTETQAQIKSSSIELSCEELKQNENITDKRIENPTKIQENVSGSERLKYEPIRNPISTETQAQIKSSSIEPSSEELKQNKNINDKRIENPTTQENESESEYFKDEPIRNPFSTETQAQIKSPSIEPSKEELRENENITGKRVESPEVKKNISGSEYYKDKPFGKPISSVVQTQIESSSTEPFENITDEEIENLKIQKNIPGSEKFKDEPIEKSILTETQAQRKSSSTEPFSEELKQNKNITDEKIENPKIQKNKSGIEKFKNTPIGKPISTETQAQIESVSIEPSSEELKQTESITMENIKILAMHKKIPKSKMIDLANAITNLIRNQIESAFSILYTNTILLQKERNNKLKVILENSITRFDHILLRSLSSWKLKTVHKIYEEKMGLHHHQTEENLMTLRTQTHIRSFVEIIEKKVLAKEFYAFSVFLAIFNRYKIPKDSQALMVMSFTQAIDSYALGQLKYCMNILKLANRKSKQGLKKKEIGLEMLFKAIRRYTKTTKQHSWVRWRLYMRTKNYKAEYTSYGLRRFSDILKRQIFMNYQDFLEQLKVISSYKAEGATLMVELISNIANKRCRPLFRLSSLYKKQNKALRQLLRTQRIRSNAALKENLRTWRLNSKFNTQIKKELLDVFTKLAFTPFKTRKSFAFSRIKAEFSSINSKKAKKEKAAKAILNLYRRKYAKILQRSIHLWGSLVSEMKRLESYEQLLRTKFSKRLLLLIIRSWSRIKGRKRRICRGLELLGKLFSIRICEYFQNLNENDPSFIWSINDESLVKFDIALIAPYLKSMIMNFHSHHKYLLKESFDRWKMAKSISHDKNVTLALEISHAFNKKKHKLLWESWHILRNPRFSMTYKQKMKLRNAIEKWESVMYRPQNILLEAFFTWKRGPKEEQLTRLKQYKQYFSS